MSKQKRQTLNAEKRNTIADVFQSHWEREDSPVMQNYNKAKENYNHAREQMKKFVEVIVRKYQPEEDIETVRAMNKKYGRSGGELYHLSLIHISEPTRQEAISYAVFCLK